MKKLDDVEIASAYKGKSFDEDRIVTIADENGDDEYVAYCCEYDEEQLEMFGITPVLFEKWEISGLVRVLPKIAVGVQRRCLRSLCRSTLPLRRKARPLPDFLL